MPAPNTTPATAIDITNLLPASITVAAADLEGLGAGALYASTCAPNQYKAIWYKFTTGDEDTFLAINADQDAAGNYDPLASVWEGTLPGLTQVVLGSQEFCESLVGGYYMNVPLNANSTYYIQINDSGNTVGLTCGLLLRVVDQPREVTPKGSIVITDDTDGFPASILSAEDGEFLNFFFEYPAGEFADWLPNGVVCLMNGENAQSVVFLNSNQVILNTENLGAFVVGIVSNKVDKFYVLTQGGGSSRIITEFDSTGTLTGETWTLPANGNSSGVFAVNRDSSIFYYGLRDTSAGIIRAYDLVNSVALPDLHAAFGTESLFGASDGFVDVDGNIYFGYAAFATSGTNGKIRKFQPDGTLLDTFVVNTAPLVYFNHFALDPDEETCWAWGFTTLGQGISVLHQFNLSDGSIALTIPSVPTRGISGGASLNDEVWAISNSCPLLLLPASPASPLSGIYYLLNATDVNAAQRRHDTLYTAYSPVETEDVKIPNAFVTGPYIGDE